MSVPTGQRRNRLTLLWLSATALGMFAFAFALVPLYGLLCQITGIQSLAQSSDTPPPANMGSSVSAPDGSDGERRWVSIKFDTTVHPDLPWRFQAREERLQIHPGETYEVQFSAHNRSSGRVTGQAIPHLIPWQANDYFHKIECFCFRQQTLEGFETRLMPLRFSVSPELPEAFASLTLSYSFMRQDEPERMAGSGHSWLATTGEDR